MPCERCVRLNRPCVFGHDERVSKVRRAQAYDDDGASGRHGYTDHPEVSNLLGHGLHYASIPTPLTLPQQLFPWQAIRLHHLLAPESTHRRAVDMTAGAEAMPHEVDGPAARGSDNDAYVRHLWDVTISTAMEQASGRGQLGAAAAGKKRPRDVTSTAANAAEDTSQLNEISTLADVINDPTPSFVCVYEPAPSFALLRLTCNRPCLDLFGWSQSEVDLRIEHGVPLRWLHPEDVLVRSVSALNARRSQLTEYTFEGRYLRRMVGSAHLLPMLQHALSSISRVITRQAVQVGPLASTAALPVAAASPASSLGLPLPVVSPALLPAYKGAFDRALGDFLEADDDDVPSALGDLDECVKYKVLCAREIVSHQYWPSGSLHMTVTRFCNVDDGSGVLRFSQVPAASRQAQETALLFEDEEAGFGGAVETTDASDTLVRPHDFDVCDDTAAGDGEDEDGDGTSASDTEARDAAATIAAVASSGAFGYAVPSLAAPRAAAARRQVSDVPGVVSGTAVPPPLSVTHTSPRTGGHRLTSQLEGFPL